MWREEGGEGKNAARGKQAANGAAQPSFVMRPHGEYFNHILIFVDFIHQPMLGGLSGANRRRADRRLVFRIPAVFDTGCS